MMEAHVKHHSHHLRDTDTQDFLCRLNLYKGYGEDTLSNLLNTFFQRSQKAGSGYCLHTRLRFSNACEVPSGVPSKRQPRDRRNLKKTGTGSREELAS